jgi:hypothetical protein
VSRHSATPLTSHTNTGLKKFLKKNVIDEELAIIDKKLGGIIQEKMGITCKYR